MSIRGVLSMLFVVWVANIAAAVFWAWRAQHDMRKADVSTLPVEHPADEFIREMREAGFL